MKKTFLAVVLSAALMPLTFAQTGTGSGSGTGGGTGSSGSGSSSGYRTSRTAVPCRQSSAKFTPSGTAVAPRGPG